MSRTIVPPPRRIKLRYVFFRSLLKMIHEQIVYVYADYDKAGDVEDHAYYAGLIDAYSHVEHELTVRKPKKRKGT